MIVVDSSSIISLAVNCLTPILELFREEFITTPGVFEEIIGRPSKTKKFGFESLRIQRLFNEGVIKVESVPEEKIREFMDEANNVYQIQGKPIKIMHRGESEMLLLGAEKKADGFLMDERTARLLLEDPQALAEMLSRRSRKKVRIDSRRLSNLKRYLPEIPVIRSSELIAVAYEKGLLTKYTTISDKKIFTSALNALKLSGCAITWDEIDEYDKMIF
ncbi:MAG TPA: hypothetical protein ENN13_02570 [Candidatus Altiarchaeales archaeon]|nr:hypothetical protein [Candidatus Altiarchaeales archaeon]